MPSRRLLCILVLALLAAPPAGGSALATAPPLVATGERGRSFSEPFSHPGWYRGWGMREAPPNTEWVPDASGSGGHLRVHFRAGTNTGSSFFFPLPGAQRATLSFRLRLEPGWQAPAVGNVKLPGFGRPLFGPDGRCTSACGGAPADGVAAYSARMELRGASRPGYYVYDVRALHLGSAYGHPASWSHSGLLVGRWHTIDQHIHMNTPSVANGRLAARVDGRPVFDGRDYRFRLVPTLDVAAVWFDLHYGGSQHTAPRDMAISIDDVAISAP